MAPVNENGDSLVVSYYDFGLFTDDPAEEDKPSQPKKTTKADDA